MQSVKQSFCEKHTDEKPTIINLWRFCRLLQMCSCSTQSIVAIAGATHPGYYYCQCSVIYGVEIAYTLITFIRWRLLNAALVYTSALVIKNSLALFLHAPDCFYGSHKYTVVYL